MIKNIIPCVYMVKNSMKNIHLQYTWTHRSMYFLQFFIFFILCCKHRILVNKLGTPAVPLTLKMNCELACTVLQYRSRGGLTNHTKGAFQGSPQMHTQCIFLVFPFLKWNEKKKKRFSFLFNSFSVENKMTRRYTDPQT